MDSYQLPSHKDSQKLLKSKIETKMARVWNGLQQSLMNDNRVESQTESEGRSKVRSKSKSKISSREVQVQGIDLKY